MLAFNQVTLRVAGEVLIEHFTATIYQGQKIGLIGANGTGKSTLFRLISQRLEPDLGEVSMPADLVISHMEQEISEVHQAAMDYVLQGDKIFYQTKKAIARAEADGRHDALARLYETLENIDGYAAPARAGQILAGLGFTEAEFQLPVSEFSGGWRIRLNLARTLMCPADLLLLDEPTNHLDLDAILWLARWLHTYSGTLLLISHDREFLDETVDHIAYLNRQQITLYPGNYSRFETLKAARLAEQHANFLKQQREVKAIDSFVTRFRYKATKARQAQSRLKALERMKLIAPAHIDSPFRFQIPHAEKISNPLMVLDRVLLGYDTPVLRQVSLSLHPGDRIGLLGPNGAGKSTLVKSLAGELAPLQGDITPGGNLQVGYFSQHQMDSLQLSLTAYDHLAALDRSLSEQHIRNYLGQFDFHGDKVFEPVSHFSGGEKARLSLGLVTHRKPNLLLLDEPTNHLDMDMRQALTVALQDFEGAMLVISHDRHLLNNTVDRFFLVDDGEVAEWDGDLIDYRDRVLGISLEQGKTQPRRQQTASPPTSTGHQRHAERKESQQLKTRIRTLESRIERLQEKLQVVETELYNNDTYQQGDQDNLQSLLREQMSLADQIEALEAEWIEKSERLEQLQTL